MSLTQSSTFISNFVFCIPNTKLVDAAADSIQTSVDQRGHGAQSDLLQVIPASMVRLRVTVPVPEAGLSAVTKTERSIDSSEEQPANIY